MNRVQVYFLFLFSMLKLSSVLAYIESTISQLYAIGNQWQPGEKLTNLYFCCYFTILIASALKITHFSFKIKFVCCTVINMSKLNVPN